MMTAMAPPDDPPRQEQSVLDGAHPLLNGAKVRPI